MIHDIPPVNNYIGNSSTTTFDFNFYIENTSQLEVYLYDSYQTKTKLTENVDYSVNEVRNGNGSYITFPLQSSEYDILDENQRISLVLSLPISQETEYNNSSLLNLSSLEYSLDYITRLVQILSRQLERCIKAEEGETINPGEYISNIKTMAKEVSDSKTIITGYLNSIIGYYNSNTTIYNNITQYQEKFNLIDTFTETISGLESTTLKTDGSNIASNFYGAFQTNVTSSFQDYISQIGLPNHSSSNVVYFNKNTTYTAPTDGWIDFAVYTSSSAPSYYDIYAPNSSTATSRYLAGLKVLSGSSACTVVIKEFLPKGYSFSKGNCDTYCISDPTRTTVDTTHIRFTPAFS